MDRGRAQRSRRAETAPEGGLAGSLQSSERPAAPSAGQAPALWVFLGGLGLGKAFNSGKRPVRFCFWENQRQKDGCQGKAPGEHQATSHKFPNHFSAQIPLILVPWEQTRNKAQRIKQAGGAKTFSRWLPFR